MKNINTKTVATLLIIGIATQIGKINDILEFYEKTKNMNWYNIISIAGYLALIIGLIYYGLEINQVAKFINENKIDIKNLQLLKNQNEALIMQNEALKEAIKDNQVYQNINTAITYDNIICACQSAESKRSIANVLLSFHKTNGITIPNWKDYGIPKEIITEMELIYHEKETEKLKQLKSDT